jgi:hypothetical protein
VPSPNTLQSRIHRASCSELTTLLAEIEEVVTTYPTLVNYALNHWYREYNKRRLNNCSGADMIEPHDAGLRPLELPSFAPLTTDVVMALENNDWFALENGNLIGIE